MSNEGDGVGKVEVPPRWLMKAIGRFENAAFIDGSNASLAASSEVLAAREHLIEAIYKYRKLFTQPSRKKTK